MRGKLYVLDGLSPAVEYRRRVFENRAEAMRAARDWWREGCECLQVHEFAGVAPWQVTS